MAALCDSCKQLKQDAQNRPLLRVVDQSGKRTVDPFEGVLCDHCFKKAQTFGTPEHVWILEQISKGPARKRA